MPNTYKQLPISLTCLGYFFKLFNLYLINNSVLLSISLFVYNYTAAITVSECHCVGQCVCGSVYILCSTPCGLQWWHCSAQHGEWLEHCWWTVVCLYCDRGTLNHTSPSERDSINFRAGQYENVQVDWQLKKVISDRLLFINPQCLCTRGLL